MNKIEPWHEFTKWGDVRERNWKQAGRELRAVKTSLKEQREEARDRVGLLKVQRKNKVKRLGFEWTGGASNAKGPRRVRIMNTLFAFFNFGLRWLFNTNRRKFHYTKHSKTVFNNRLRMCVVNCNFHHNNYKIATEPLSKAVPFITVVETMS